MSGSPTNSNVVGTADPGAPASVGALRPDLDPRVTCPKHMVFGPCGGVRPDGSCELPGIACPFVDQPRVQWKESSRSGSGSQLLELMERRPVVVTDLRVRPFDRASVSEVAGVLAQACDAVLIGEHQGRPDLPPTVLASLCRSAGARPWVTLSCRDRNAVVLESELRALTASGADGVHCVTGDARGPAASADVTQVFDLDALRLTALAVDHGLCASVAATPIAPPQDRRPLRMLDKERAGAGLAFVNHAGGPVGVGRFVRAARAVGVTLPFIACVAVFTDAASIAVLEAFPGLELDQHEVDAVLSAKDPVVAGIDAAVRQAEQMLLIDGVEGVNLSGSATVGTEADGAEIMAAVGAAVGNHFR